MITQFKVRNNFLLNSLFFPSALVEWNNLDSDIRNFSSHWIFKKNILTFVRPRSNDVFNVSHPKGHNFLTCLHVGLSYLREHKFKHNFLDTLNPICICGFLYRNIESLLSPLPKILVMSRRIFCIRLKISPQIFQKTNNMTSILLYGDLSFHLNLTPAHSIHLLTIFYPQRRFESPLFTVSWFIIQVFIIFVFQLNEFPSFVVFYPHFIFFSF